jgi:hypothetical protein
MNTPQENSSDPSVLAWGSPKKESYEPSQNRGVYYFPEMSVHISSFVWKMKFNNPALKLLAVSMADQAADDGTCFPSMRHLIERTELCEKTIRAHIKELIAIGLLTVEPRKRANGSSTSNLYTLSEPSQPLLPSPDLPPHPLVTVTTPTLVAATTPINHHSNHQKESSSVPATSELLLQGKERLHRLFNRRPTKQWDAKETKALPVILDTTEEEWICLEAYYRHPFTNDFNPRRRDLITLLNNWNGEIDRACQFCSETSSSETVESPDLALQSHEDATWSLKGQIAQQLAKFQEDHA